MKPSDIPVVVAVDAAGSTLLGRPCRPISVSNSDAIVVSGSNGTGDGVVAIDIIQGHAPGAPMLVGSASSEPPADLMRMASSSVPLGAKKTRPPLFRDDETPAQRCCKLILYILLCPCMTGWLLVEGTADCLARSCALCCDCLGATAERIAVCFEAVCKCVYARLLRPLGECLAAVGTGISAYICTPLWKGFARVCSCVADALAVSARHRAHCPACVSPLSRRGDPRRVESDDRMPLPLPPRRCSTCWSCRSPRRSTRASPRSAAVCRRRGAGCTRGCSCRSMLASPPSSAPSIAPSPPWAPPSIAPPRVWAPPSIAPPRVWAPPATSMRPRAELRRAPPISPELRRSPPRFTDLP